jgi:hypothetical protein
VISQVKVIAEPWDANGGYVLGQFPPPWAQWNDHYRANIRDYWRAQAGIGDLATRLAGSRDVFSAADQTPDSSVNVVTCHDGFTLTDLVSYNAKHNEANGNNNSDGSDDNRSWNCGTEGPTTDPGIVALRAQQRRNFLATMLMSQGVPMILGGDEIGRTQHGNNNTYCQDNAISYYDWDLDQERTDLLAGATLVWYSTGNQLNTTDPCTAPSGNGPATTDFTRDIAPLFRPIDIEHMGMGPNGVGIVDLSSAADVRDHIDDILHQLRTKKMPPHQPWTPEQIAKLEQWQNR